MKTLAHPPAEEITVQGILHALSDPVRARIFAGIAGANCPKICCAFQHVADREIPKSTLSHHFRILREAGLIRSARCGVEMRNTSRCDEVNARFPGLLQAIVDAWGIDRAAQVQ